MVREARYRDRNARDEDVGGINDEIKNLGEDLERERKRQGWPGPP